LDWLEPGSVHYEAANTTFWIASSIACILAGYLPLALVLRSSAEGVAQTRFCICLLRALVHPARFAWKNGFGTLVDI